jgi:hypothetical protein
MYINDLRNDGLIIKDSRFTKLSAGPVSSGIPTIIAELDTGYKVGFKPEDIIALSKKFQELGIKV